MSDQPIYRVGAVPAGVPGDDGGSGRPVEVTDPASFPDPDATPGWVLIAPDLAPATVLDLLARLANTHGSWSPVLVRSEDGGDPELLPLGLGWPVRSSEAAERIREGGASAGYLSYRLAMADLSRVRHDINNPLTAALAEVQLTMLDADPGSELEESLKVVETQIRRIRDLVQELTRYRTPRP